MCKKLRKGDSVIVIAGKDKGKIGSIIKFINEDRLVVQGINLIKKHVKPNPMKGVTGGIIDSESFIHVSNVAIYNYTTKKADKIGFRSDDLNTKTRFFKSTGEVI